MASEREIVGRLLAATGIRNDDAALLMAEGTLAITTDISFESSHAPVGTPHYSMGWRSAVASFSDLAAIGAKPLAFLLALGLPAKDAERTALEVVRGARDACRKHGAHYLGGDTKRAGEITLAGFALGKLQGAPLFRSTALPGDVVCVSGAVGDAACGFMALSKKLRAPQKLLNAFLRPRARILESELVSQSVRRAACMDVSDGFLFTCSEVARLAKVRISIDADAIPVSREAAKFCHENAIDLRKILDWGEDYSLVFCMSEDDYGMLRQGSKLVQVGTVKGGSGLQLDGKKVATEGYDAFKS